jgi:diketogulonate reductase-like aldo/keto reductase
MEEARRLPGGKDIVTNQVFNNLSHRGVEWDLLPWCRMRGLPVMDYSPLDEGKLARNRKLKPIAARHGVSRAQVALAWLLGQEGICRLFRRALRHRAPRSVPGLPPGAQSRGTDPERRVRNPFGFPRALVRIPPAT